jgi:hypothetical protein
MESVSAKWDWDLVQRLLNEGKTVREIHEMDEFGGRGMNFRYLKNQVSARKMLARRPERAVAVAETKAFKIADVVPERKKKDTSEHHMFVFDQLERMRRAISQHKVKGSVKELREMVDLLNKYIDAADKAYGLKQEAAQNGRGASMNAMVALHISPPSKAQLDSLESKIIEMGVDTGAEGSNQGASAEG